MKLTEEYIPTFVRGGAFIPMARGLQTTDFYSADELEVHFYFDDEVSSSNGKVYHDEGTTPNAFDEGE